jgi:hypothetical protein
MIAQWNNQSVNLPVANLKKEKFYRVRSKQKKVQNKFTLAVNELNPKSRDQSYFHR